MKDLNRGHRESSSRIPAEQESLTLSACDWEVVVRALDEPNKPRPRLSAVLKRYREWEARRR